MMDIFSNVDNFFAKALLKKNKEEDVFLAVKYLFFASRMGNLCVKVDFKKKIISPLFDIDKEKLLKGFKKIPDHLIEKSSFFGKKPIFFHENAFYLQKNYIFETSILKNLLKILKRKKNKIDKFTYEIIDDLFLKKEIDKKALEVILKNPISFIFGSPGSGKTYLASYLAYLWLKIKKENEVLIIAPTGKATINLEKKVLSVIEDKNRISSYTIHALINKYQSYTNGFFEEQGFQKITQNLIIIDEASMIDAKMMRYLFCLISPSSKVVFIGDPDQLPSIESGNLFSIFKNPIFPSYTLKNVKRFSNKEVSSLAESIKRKDIKIDKTFFIEMKDKQMRKILEYVDRFYKKPSFLDPQEAFKGFSSFRILSSMKRGGLGTDILNKKIYEYIKGKKSIPIMITKNDYRLKIYNGMLGILHEDYIYFEDDRKIPFFLVPSFEYAYSISVHKSQGSEYDNVLLILPEKSELFGRELLYTAITRAKKDIKIFSKKEIFLEIAKKGCFMENNILKRINYLK